MTDQSNEENKFRDISDDLLRMYYEHQYNRVSELEKQRLTLTHIIIIISIGAFSLGYSELNNLNLINGLFIPCLVVFSNLFAILYIRCISDYSQTHKNRARKLLKNISTELYNHNKEIKWQSKYSSSSKSWRTPKNLQIYVHSLMIIASFVIFALYLYCRYCPNSKSICGSLF